MSRDSILIVDDNADDYFAACRVLEHEGLSNPLIHLDSGDAALDYLKGKGRHAQAPPPRPQLVLLDINMPGMKGTEVLQIIRADSQLKDLPVIMLTSSDADRDVLASLQGGASAYVTKPLHLKGLVDAIGRVTSHRLEFRLRLVPTP